MAHSAQELTDFDIARLVAVLPLCIWIIVTNVLTVATVVSARSLQTKPFVLVSSLAVADFIVGVVDLVGIIYYIAIHKHRLYYYSDTYLKTSCAVMMAVILFPNLNSIFHLLAITLDRYVAILHPLRYQQLMTLTKVKVMIVVSWSMSLMCCLPVFAWLQTLDVKCDGVILMVPSNYGFIFVVAPYLCAACTMLILYIFIFRAARQNQVHSSNVILNKEAWAATNVKTIKPQKLKLVKMFLMVVGVFVLCSLPLVIMMTLSMSFKLPQTTTLLVIRTVVTWLFAFNSGINCVIYVARDSTFRYNLNKYYIKVCLAKLRKLPMYKK